MLFLWIFIGIICFILLIYAVHKILENKRKEEEQKRIDATPQGQANKVALEIKDVKSEAYNKMMSLRQKIIELQRSIHKLYDQQISTTTRLRELMDNYVVRYSTLQTIDEDFKQLLSIYKRDGGFYSEEFKTVLRKCKEKNILEMQECFSLNGQLKNLENECLSLENKVKEIEEKVKEWEDVVNEVKREKWTNPDCERIYNEIAKLGTNSSYRMLEYMKAPYKEYLNNSISARNDIQMYYNIGRSGDKVAIWNNDYVGQIISIDDVLYFQIFEETRPGAYTQTPSKLGMAVTEAMWGTAAAVSSAMQKAAQNAPNTTKYAKIFFKFETKIQPLRVDSDYSINRVQAMFPEKQK
ncbi:MAG: hypothetical protein K2M36_02375 [Clostridia bacterium]|nr:hypothetical protein [Clostridia bacterium]